MEEYSLGLIKPNAADRYHEIFSTIEERKLKIVAHKQIFFDRQSLMEIYEEIAEKNYFQSFCEFKFMMSGRCIAFVVKGTGAITSLNEIVGNVDPHKAKAGTLRSMFGSNVRRNAIHSSKDKKHFENELKILFPEISLKK